MRTFVESVIHSLAVLGACFTMLRANTVGPPIGRAYERFTDLHNCGKTFGCMRSPAGCEPKYCDAIATWKADPSNAANYIIELGGKNPKNDFLAISFCLSNDAMVKDDSCILCEYTLSDDGDKYATSVLSYIGPNGTHEEITAQAEFVSLYGYFYNKYVWCKASRPITFSNFNNKVFNLRTASGDWNSFYAMIASQQIIDGKLQAPTERLIWPAATSLNLPVNINSGSQHWTVFSILPLLAVISHLL